MNKQKLDITIFNAFINGNEKAFSVIFNLYSERILKRIYYILKDEDISIEVMQQLFVKLWLKRADLSITYETFESYLYKMVSSLSIDHLRKNVRNQNLINTLANSRCDLEKSTEEYYIQKESLSIIEDAINMLPPQRKQIFTLCKLEGKSYFEVSEILGISVSTVSNQLVSATKSIRNYASKYHLEAKIITIIFFL
ncbi:RNA polymerase sigma factor [Sphingobacterium bovistauri]|uniref:Sigma-70 family RNA polymerase sigma factor n=1 Tax=Sphingobacterium bovistauri TaxID=2781959 RepID=A0ABS7Z293_9SPHI|nr:sigma-70 family RNA polymerase sigma factor [Sphingobacterium bovistauri]MCA5004296.1 sigma-70 family RNA polymerase sigma factor [Sphingobacterium bovistauri]